MDTPNFENLEKYSLYLHGDGYERRWWDLLSNDFPEYEIFWRAILVPLTNRVDQTILISDQRWIGFRLGIPEQLQRLAMTHYSVFYYIARATECMNRPEGVFVEDVLFLLDSCADNVKAFFGVAKQILGDFNCKRNFLPRQFPPSDDNAKTFSHISHYRDIVLHNPVLGRIVRDGVENLPKERQLEGVKDSWAKAWRLAEAKLIKKQELLSRLRSGLIAYIRVKLATLTAEMAQVRNTEKFRKVAHLDRFLPISAPPVLPSTSPPLAASGQALRAPDRVPDVIVLSSNATSPPSGRKPRR